MKWVPVTKLEDLPEQGSAVLVYGWAYDTEDKGEKEIAVGWVNKDEDPEEPIVAPEIERILYWMRLPDAPKN